MNCFTHPNTTSVSTCLNCGKGLCVTCTAYYALPICNTCYKNLKKEDFIKVIRETLTVLLLGALVMCISMSCISKEELAKIMFFSASPSSKFFAVACAYAAVGTVVGWRTLSNLTAGYFLVLPIIGWIIYIMFKLPFAIFIGSFYTPIWFIKKIIQLKKLWPTKE